MLSDNIFPLNIPYDIRPAVTGIIPVISHDKILVLSEYDRFRGPPDRLRLNHFSSVGLLQFLAVDVNAAILHDLYRLSG